MARGVYRLRSLVLGLAIVAGLVFGVSQVVADPPLCSGPGDACYDTGCKLHCGQMGQCASVRVFNDFVCDCQCIQQD